MNNKGFLSALIPAIFFIWFGILCTSDLIEAPLRFKTPHMDREAALSLGKAVFVLVNRVEIGLAIVSGILIYFTHSGRVVRIALCTAMIPLLLQSIWLLPALVARTETILSGRIPEPSLIHPAFTTMELIKLGALLTGGLWQLRVISRETPGKKSARKKIR